MMTDLKEILALAERKNAAVPAFNCYNVCSNTKTTNHELAELIGNILPYEITIDYSGNVKGEQSGIYCSFDKAKKMLDWQPRISLREGLVTTIDWAKYVLCK